MRTIRGKIPRVHVKHVDFCDFLLLNFETRKIRGVWKDYLFLGFGMVWFLFVCLFCVFLKH